MKRVLLTCLSLAAIGAVPQDPAKEQLRQSLKDNDLAGPWIYDDVERGYCEAARTGKPLMVVLRCVP